jgi:uncharacterized membrane protein
MINILILLIVIYLIGAVISYGRIVAVLNSIKIEPIINYNFTVFYICIGYSIFSWIGFIVINIVKNKYDNKTTKYLEFKIKLNQCQHK